MEVFAQYLDNLDDLVFAVLLKVERLRLAIQFFLFASLSVTLQVLCIYVALQTPPLAGAVAALLAVAILYRSAVAGPRGTRTAA